MSHRTYHAAGHTHYAGHRMRDHVIESQRQAGLIGQMRYKNWLGSAYSTGVHDAPLGHRFHGHFNDQYRGGSVGMDAGMSSKKRRREILDSISAVLNS